MAEVRSISRLSWPCSCAGFLLQMNEIPEDSLLCLIKNSPEHTASQQVDAGTLAQYGCEMIIITAGLE